MTINEATGVSEKIRTCVQCGTEFKVEKGHKFGRCCSRKCCNALWYSKNRDKCVERVKKWRSENKDKCVECAKKWRLENKEKHAERMKKWRAAQPAAWHMWAKARNRARSKGLPFTITPEDIVVPTHCPYLGIPLERAVGKGGAMPNSPSLDRIIGALGYVPHNIQVISNLANVMKNSATQDQLITFAHAVLRLHS